MADFLLKEDSTYILLEDGSKILLETQTGGGIPDTFSSYMGAFSMIPKQYRNYNFT
jgi:hypothetical protein